MSDAARALPAVYKVQEVAEIFKVHEQTVRHWIKSGQLDHITLPPSGPRARSGSYAVTQAQLDAFIAARSS